MLPPSARGFVPSSFEMLSLELARLSDNELLAEVAHVAGDERTATARLVATLVEVEKRQLYRDAGCSSLYTFCTEILGLSESEAYLRMEAARAARKFPVILERLGDASLTLTAVSMLAKHLTEANHAALLAEARHKSKREIQGMLARINPRADAVAILRRLPAAPAVADRTRACAEDRTTVAPAPEESPRIFAETEPIPLQGGLGTTAGRETKAKREAEEGLVSDLLAEHSRQQINVPGAPPSCVEELVLD